MTIEQDWKYRVTFCRSPATPVEKLAAMMRRTADMMDRRITITCEITSDPVLTPREQAHCLRVGLNGVAQAVAAEVENQAAECVFRRLHGYDAY